MSFWKSSDVTVKSNVLFDALLSHLDWNSLQLVPDVGKYRVKTESSDTEATWIWKYNTLTGIVFDNTL